MSGTTYNGYTNRETWAVSLHLMDSVVEYINEDIDQWAKSDVEEAAEIFKEIVSEMLEESGIATFSLLWELLDTSAIDWRQLGELALDACDW